jgi:hypothetical protein
MKKHSNKTFDDFTVALQKVLTVSRFDMQTRLEAAKDGKKKPVVRRPSSSGRACGDKG